MIRHSGPLRSPAFGRNQDVHEQLGTAASSIQFAKRAAERAAAVHGEMKQGLTGLATVAAIAPWLGLFGTLGGIFNSFRGVGGNKTSIMAAMASDLSDSLVPTAIGLLVGLSSLLCYRYLASRLEISDREMEGASLELVNQLSLRGRLPREDPAR